MLLNLTQDQLAAPPQELHSRFANSRASGCGTSGLADPVPNYPPLPDSLLDATDRPLSVKRMKSQCFRRPIPVSKSNQSWLRADWSWTLKFDRRISPSLCYAPARTIFDYHRSVVRSNHMLLLSALILYQNVAIVAAVRRKKHFAWGRIFHSKKWRPTDFSARSRNWSWILKKGYEKWRFRLGYRLSLLLVLGKCLL